ncbi:GNAT family N-acetyltransferase [Psychromarinibacter sp. C21-152]|uniref:GNAT family N-acetyltransferase n=1 Tax=Psychromarinibacter sediminicola TaxID=3033385 RepID=A0AAE3NQN2_9RHOB|nr:GNAT family N-acetyltransferase [Psychromarinibacter sediminicola]MDF0600636.1 GNAT family N-acetyltransferase [Psychromarinibacter sediminicola]
MTLPDARQLSRAVEATWPAARRVRAGPWTIRDGQGGGQRVSAATAEAPVSAADIALAEAEMQRLGQPCLFLVREGEDRLDRLLEEAGYRLHDPVALYAMPVAALTDAPVPPVSAFTIWPPLAIMRDLWAAGGVGPARQAVMTRVSGDKTGVLARTDDAPAGAAFVACDGKTAMIHAIHVQPDLRRRGVATNIMRAAAHWAQDRGADTLSLAVTRANDAANRLYSSIGMQVVGYYHYRLK